MAIQAVNETIDELYAATRSSKPNERSSSTITLVAAQQDYALASDLVQLNWPLIDRTNSQYIYEMDGGYDAILIQDLEQDDTGLPYFGAISPVDSKLYLDRKPTSAEAGRVYTYQYDKDLSLSVLTDTVPFTNATFRAMVPAFVQIWKREIRNEFDGDLFKVTIGRASRFVTLKQQRSSYSPR